MSTAKDLNQINANENQDFDNLDSEQVISNEYNVDERVTNSILTEGSVEKQFREFENTLTDPYATVKNFAQSQREKFNNGYAPETVNPNRLNTNPAIRLSDRATSLFNYAAQSIVESSSTVLRRQEMRGLNQGHHLVGYTSNDSGSIVNNGNETSIVTGLINRPGVQEYNNLFSDSYGTLNATFFQFQNKEVVSGLLQRQNETKIVTQGLIPSSTGKANAILANNEITAQLSNLPNRSNLTITRAYSDTESSIHPKMGYNDKYAFIGTQNLTNALPKYNTQENLLVIRRSTDVEMSTSVDSFRSVARILQTNIAGNRNAVHFLNKQDFAKANQFAQGILAEQIVTAQNSLLSVLNDDPDSTVSPIKFASKLTENLRTLSNGSSNNMGTYVFTSADIFNRLSSTIANASKLSTTDRVVISGKELNIIFSNEDAGLDVLNFKQNILALAKAGRLTILTDNAYINTLSRQNLDPNSTSIDEIGRNILSELTQRNQIRGVSLGVNHEKSTMVFGGGVDDAGQLKFLATGSANYSAGAMLTKNKNTELMVAIGIDNYQQDSNSIVERTMGVSILSQLNREVDNRTIIHDRYETLSGLDFLTGKTTFSDTRIIEQNASTIGVQTLKKEIAALNTRLGGNLIELSDRFNSSGKLIGVRTIIRPLDNISNQVVINLSVNREQNVVLSDLNKVISGSTFVNTGVNSKTINGQVIKAGQTVEMSSMHTAVGFLATITRELSNQSRYQLVDKSYGDLLKSGHINPYETSAEYLRLLVPELVQDRGQGKLNLSTIQNAIANKYQDGSKLAADIHNLSLKIATGHISSFNSLPSGQGGFIDELKVNPHNITRRYSLVNSWLTELASGSGETKHLKQLFIALDNDPNRVLGDIRLQAVLSSSEGKKKYNKAFNSLSSSLVNLISSPFLALHEQTYGGYQASARTPVYGEGDVANPDTILGRLATEGFMNPLSVAHSTEIGEAGQFYRAINHTASSDYLKLPGHGGLNQVKVIDSDLHEGAVAIYSNKKLFSSLQNHGFINRDEYKSSLESIVNRKIDDEELNPIFNTSRIVFNYAFPESKLEQLQQRIKNTTGARVDLDINYTLVNSIKSGLKTDVGDYKTQGNLLTGKIKAALPRAQSEKVKAYLAEFQAEHSRLPTKQETTNYFRNLEFDRSLTERGVIGEENYKRVAINAGFSNMGDYIYGNADALPETGYLRLLKLKLDTKNLNNLEDTQRKLTTAFKQGNVIYNEPVEVYGNNLPVVNQLKALETLIEPLANKISQQQGLDIGLEGLKSQLNELSIRHQETYNKLLEIKTNVDTYLSDKPELKALYTEKSTLSNNLYEFSQTLFDPLENPNALTPQERAERRSLKSLFLIKDQLYNIHLLKQEILDSDDTFAKHVNVLDALKREKFNLGDNSTNPNLVEYRKQEAALTEVFTEINQLKADNPEYADLLIRKEKANRYKKDYLNKLLFTKVAKGQPNIGYRLLRINNLSSDIYAKTTELEGYREFKADIFTKRDELAEAKQAKYALTQGLEEGSSLNEYITITGKISKNYTLVNRFRADKTKTDVFKVLDRIAELKQSNYNLLDNAKPDDLLSRYKEASDNLTASYKTLYTLREQNLKLFSIKDSIAKYSKLKNNLIGSVKDNDTHILSRYITNQKEFKTAKEDLNKYTESHTNVIALLKRESELKQSKYKLTESDDTVKQFRDLSKILFEVGQRFEEYKNTHAELLNDLQTQRDLNTEKYNLINKTREDSDVLDRYIETNKSIFTTKENLNAFIKNNDISLLFSAVENLRQSIKDVEGKAPDGYLNKYKETTNLISEQFKLLDPFKESHKNILEDTNTSRNTDYEIRKYNKKNSELINLLTKTKTEKRAIKHSLTEYALSHTKVFSTIERLDKLHIKTIEIKARASKQGSTLITQYDKLNKEIYDIKEERRSLINKFDLLTKDQQDEQRKQYQDYENNLLDKLDNLDGVKRSLSDDPAAGKSGLTNYIKIKGNISKERKTLKSYREYTENQPLFKLIDRLDVVKTTEQKLKSIFTLFSKGKDNYTQNELYNLTGGDKEINEALWSSDHDDNRAYGKLLAESKYVNTRIAEARLDPNNKDLFVILSKITGLFKSRSSLLSTEEAEGKYTFLQDYHNLKANLKNFNIQLKTELDKAVNKPIKDILGSLDVLYKQKKEIVETVKSAGSNVLETYRTLQNQLKEVRGKLDLHRKNNDNYDVFVDDQIRKEVSEERRDLEQQSKNQGLTGIDEYKEIHTELKGIQSNLDTEKKKSINEDFFKAFNRLKASNLVYLNILKEDGDKVWKVYNAVNTKLKSLYEKLEPYKTDANQYIFDAIDEKKKNQDTKSQLEKEAVDTQNNRTLEYIENKKELKSLNTQLDTFKSDKKNETLFKLLEIKESLSAKKKALIASQTTNDQSINEYIKIKENISTIENDLQVLRSKSENKDVFDLISEINKLKGHKKALTQLTTKSKRGEKIYNEYTEIKENTKALNTELSNHPLTERYNLLLEKRQAIYESTNKLNNINDPELTKYKALASEIKSINEYLYSEFPELMGELDNIKDNSRNLNAHKTKLKERAASSDNILLADVMSSSDRKSDINNQLQTNYNNELEELNKITENKASLREELNDLITKSKELAARKASIYETMHTDRHNLAILQHEYNKLLKANNLVVVNEDNQTKYKLDKGLYGFDEAGKPVQLGRFERDDIITLNNINITDSEGRHSAVSFKVGSAKDKGYSIFTDNASIVTARDKGVLTIEASELVIKNPSSGIRLVGVKGPVLYMDSTLFDNVESHLNQRTRDTQDADRFAVNVNQEIYSMNTFSQFKEFSYESGIKLLSVDSVRQSLTGEKNAISGHNLAENLALLFIEKDKTGEVRTALQEHLSNTGRRQVAQTLNNINGGDFSEISDGKSKYNLGVIANGLTMLADPSDSNYSKNVIEGNLTGVKQLVLRALKEGPQGDEARLLLQQQSKALIDLAYEKGGVYGYNSELLYFEGNSPIVKGAGMLTHVNFIGSQLLNNPFEKGKSNLQSGLFELKVDNVNTYLTDKVHKQKVDFVASTAGMSLDEFNKDNLTDAEKGKLETKLSFLQKQFDSGVIIQDIKSITTSSSLVAAGVNNETAFEYQNLAGASISYLNRYRRQNKIRDEGTLIRTKESQTIRTAYAIILSASLNEDHLYDHNRSIPSLNPSDLISYRSILHKPSDIQDTRGWHTDRVNTINSLITNFTPIANRTGLLDQTIDSGDKNVYETVGKINTMAVGINNDPAVINRAIDIAEVTSKFTYYSDMTGDESAINHSQKQAQSLHNSLINKKYKSNLNSLELVSKVISDQYTNYLNQTEAIAKNRSNSPDIMLDSFSEYVAKQNPLFNNDIYNEQVINTIKNLESNTGKLRGVNGTEDMREEQIKLAIYRENERSARVVEESLYVDRVGRAKQYVDSMLSIHDIVATKLEANPSNAKLNDYLNEVSKTKNLILPAFQTIAQEDGTYQLQFKTVEAVSPHQGTLLGTDVIGKVPLVFPGHVEDVLINQVRLRKQIEVVQPTLLEIHEAVEQKRAISLSGEQVQQLQELTDLMDQSVEGVKSLANTSFAQKSYSEGETFYGNNTIPVNSLAISANEAVVGNKINNLVQGNPVERVIESYFESIKKNTESVQNNTERATLQHADIEKLKILYGNLGAKGDTLKQAAQYEEALEKTYPVDKSKPLTISEVENLHQRYSEAITGIKYEDREFISKNIMDEHYNVREVAARRGGAPAGIAASIATEFFNRTLNVNTYNQNIERKGSLLKVDPSRAYTAVILPTLSHLIAQQGDYDGDSFQLLMSNAGDNAQELLTIKNKQRILLDKINERQSVINERQTLNNNDTYQSSTQDILRSINVLQAELDIENEREQTHLNLLTKGLSASKVLESSQLNHMKKWTAFNQAIPLGAVMDMSAGTLTSFSNFSRTTIGNVEDGAEYSSKIFDKYENQLKAFTTLQKVYGSKFDINADHTSASTLGQYELDLRNESIDIDKKDIDEAFTAIKSINPEGLDYRNVSESLLTYHAAQSSMSQAFDAYIKHNAKAAGTLLNPEQIDLMQSLIGQAGTDLLGKSYNTLIPLLDQAMSDKGLQEVLNVSLNKQGSNREFETALNENAQRLGMNVEDANTLLTKLTSSEQIDKVNTRAEATFAFLGSMQQVIRDALKDKSGRGLKSNLTEILKTEYEDGRSVGDILKSPDEDLKFEDINKTRNLIFKHYVGTRLGSNLNINIPNNTPDNIKQLFTNARAGYIDSGVTGFGGLLMLRELALTESQEDYKKRFIDNDPSLVEYFNKDLEKGSVKSAQEFATRHVLNLLQRTQASFADAMLGEPQRNAKVNALINYGEKFTQQQIDSVENIHAKAGLQLMKDYGEFRRTTAYTSLNEADQKLLNTQFSQDVSLHTIRERGGLTVDDLYYLQTSAKETKRIRNHQEGTNVQEGEAESAFDPKVIQNAAIDQEFHPASISTIQRMLRRGHITADQAQSLFIDRLNSVESAIGDQPHLTPQQQEQTALMLGFNTRADLNQQERMVLAQTVAQTSSTLQHDSQSIQSLYSASEQFDNISQAIKLASTENELRELQQRQRHYSRLMNHHATNINQEKIQQTTAVESNVEQSPHILENILNEISVQSENLVGLNRLNNTAEPTVEHKTKGITLRHDQSLSALGALAIPLFLGALRDGVSLNDRALTFGYDLIQGTAHLATKQDRLITQVGELNSEAIQQRSQQTATNFQRSRITQSLQSEGALIGGLQSIAQETMFMTLSDLAYRGVDKLLARSGFENMKVGKGLGVIAAELVSTVAAMSISRAVTKQRTTDGDYVPDFVGRMLQDFAQQIWLAAEQAQLDQNRPEYEIIDTDENMNLDSTTTALLSQSELDIATGFITFDDDSAEVDGLSSSVPTFSSSIYG